MDSDNSKNYYYADTIIVVQARYNPVIEPV